MRFLLAAQTCTTNRSLIVLHSLIDCSAIREDESRWEAARREDCTMRFAVAIALALVVTVPGMADAPDDWLTRFAFLHAVGAKQLPPGPESWKAFACVAKGARPISDRDPRPPIKNWPVGDEANEAISPCKAEMDAIPQHAAKMQRVAVDLIAKLRADRLRNRP